MIFVKIMQIFLNYANIPRRICPQTRFFAFLGAIMLFFRRIPLKFTILAVRYVCKISAKLDKKSQLLADNLIILANF